MSKWAIYENFVYLQIPFDEGWPFFENEKWFTLTLNNNDKLKTP